MSSQRSLGSALLLTGGSALLPGLAHLKAGRRAAGTVLLVLFLGAAVTAAVLGSGLNRDSALRLVVQEQVLTAVIVGAAVLALVWCALLVSSYRAVRPWQLGPAGKATAGATVTAMCLAVIAPMGLVARYAYVQHDLITSVFSNNKLGFKSAGAGKDFFKNKPRLNILLLGGDAAGDRTGVRTDSMIVASIDTHTGATVLLALPRSLQHAQMPPGPARRRFPNGYTGDGGPGNELLNAVWFYGEHHHDVVPGSATPGPDLLKATIGTILGVKVDYYVLVNLFGFRDIVDAFGGVKIRITEKIPFGEQGKSLKPGLQRLTGSQALWFARSRTGSSDYKRMDRQRCMIGAIARQASPQVVFTRFQRIARATKQVISTDLPAPLLPHLVTLAAKAKAAKIDSVTFSPPLIKPARPDFDQIRRIAAQAIAASARGATAPAVTLAAPKPKPKPSATRTPAKHRRSAGTYRFTPAPHAGAISVDEACQYS